MTRYRMGGARVQKRENRRIAENLKRHYYRTKELEATGISREEASKIAYNEIVKGERR